MTSSNPNIIALSRQIKELESRILDLEKRARLGKLPNHEFVEKETGKRTPMYLEEQKNA